MTGDDYLKEIGEIGVRKIRWREKRQCLKALAKDVDELLRCLTLREIDLATKLLELRGSEGMHGDVSRLIEAARDSVRESKP